MQDKECKTCLIFGHSAKDCTFDLHSEWFKEDIPRKGDLVDVT